MTVRLSDGTYIPIEMHKVRIIQKTTLPPAAQRLAAIEEAGYNTFLLKSRDLFLDMLTDSGTNAMSDNQLAAMMVADDAYAGGESFYRLESATKDVLGFKYCVPAHQGCNPCTTEETEASTATSVSRSLTSASRVASPTTRIFGRFVSISRNPTRKA